jgi:transcriptional regulator with XRE-family HTH domain
MLTARQLQELRREPPEPNRLKAAMRIAKARQVDVSAATGLDQSHISRIANSGPSVTVETAAKLANYFGCGIGDLFPRQSQGAAA